MSIENETRVERKRTMGRNAARALVVAAIWVSAAAIAVTVLLTQHDTELVKSLLGDILLYPLLGSVVVSWLF